MKKTTSICFNLHENYERKEWKKTIAMIVTYSEHNSEFSVFHQKIQNLVWDRKNKNSQRGETYHRSLLLVQKIKT